MDGHKGDHIFPMNARTTILPLGAGGDTLRLEQFTCLRSVVCVTH